MSDARALSRRDFLRLSGITAASVTLAACAPVYGYLAGDAHPLSGLDGLPDSPADLANFRALNRLTFGPRLEERMRVAKIGLLAWIEEQLAPETIDDREVEIRLRRFETLKLKAADLAELGDKLFDEVDKTGVPADLRQATLLRQVYSRRQLYEAMVEFWTDHFNISVEKGDCWFLKTVDDRQTIRPHALGHFQELLWASAHSPAMLVYLDNQSNQAGAPNENYARELLELHTLGVEGGYSQQDVMELARCLTGWSVKTHFWRGEFTFKASQHDSQAKRVLGVDIPASGLAEAEGVLERLASNPATAQFIARKLACRFIADDPPQALITRAAGTFARTQGDLRAVLRALLLDGLKEAQPKFKRPANFLVSTLRMLGARTDGGPALHDFLLRMGQPYFAWPTPDGYPDRAATWQGNLMPRWQFALALARGEIAGTRLDLPALIPALKAESPTQVTDRLSRILLGVSLIPAVRDELLAALKATDPVVDAELPTILTAGLVASPAFQWR